MTLLFIALFNSILGLSVLFPIMGPLGRTLGLSEVEVGALSTSYALMQFLLSTYWGKKSETIGRKPVLLVGILGFSLSFFAFGAVAELGVHGILSRGWVFALLMVARLIGGALSSATFPTAQAYAADMTSKEDRTSGMAVIGAAFGLGVIFGPGIGAVLSKISMLTPVFFSASVGLLNAVFVSLMLKEPKEKTSRVAPPLGPVARKVWPLLAVGLVATLASVAMEQTVAFYFQDRLGLTEEGTPPYVGAALVAYGLMAVFVQGFLVRRYKWPPRLLLRVGLPIALLGFLTFIFAKSFLFLTVALVLQGLGQGLALPGVTAGVSLAVGEDSQGAVAGLNSSSQGFARMIGPIIGTALYALRPELPYGFAALLIAAVAAVVLLYRGLPGLQEETEGEQEGEPATEAAGPTEF